MKEQTSTTKRSNDRMVCNTYHPQRPLHINCFVYAILLPTATAAGPHTTKRFDAVKSRLANIIFA